MNPFRSLSVIPTVLPTTRLADIFSVAFTVGPFATTAIYRQWGGKTSKGREADIAPMARTSSHLLMAGKGVAKDYSWLEDYIELEIKVKVPKETRAKDIEFEVGPTFVGLYLRHPQNGTLQTLLDPTRKLCGSICVDGTFWALSDDDEFEDHKEVTVTLEKKSYTPTYGYSQYSKIREWKGVFKTEEEGEVTNRDYQEPEEFDVKEYAAQMGVDLDNLNMSNVDKKMFSDAGFSNTSMIKELLAEGVLRDDTFDFSENNANATEGGESTSSGPQIPFLDTDSKWHSATKKVDTKEVVDPPDETAAQDETHEHNFKDDPKEQPTAPEKSQVTLPEPLAVPVDQLTLASLKQMLRLRGLDVTGDTKELQARLHKALLMESRHVKSDDTSEDETKKYS
eukprot:Nitzschia sp. Nitz4//scaffold123_size70294//30780//31982//NITZ4_005926-RA/size70294-processed-gene-0.7-mRNA-1//1//CDS//3329534479//8644//frame0